MDVSTLDAEFRRLVLIAAVLAVNLHALAFLRWRRAYLAAFGFVFAAVAALSPVVGLADAFYKSRGAAGGGDVITAAALDDVVGFFLSGGIVSGLVAALVGAPCFLVCWRQGRRELPPFTSVRPLAPGYRLTLGVGGIIAAGYAPFVGCLVVGSLFPGRRYVGPARVTFCLSPDGKSVVYSRADGRLYRLALPTRHVRALTAPLVGDTAAKQLVDPALSPDGTRIACGGATGLTLLTFEGGVMRRLAVGEAYAAFDPCFSPDGRQIAFVRARNNPGSPTGVWWVDYDLWLVNVDGTGLRRLTDKRYLPARRPRFLPDGRTVVYSAEPSGSDGREGLYMAPADGGRPEADCWFSRLGPARADGTPAYSESPAVSPDGKRIAFVCDAAAPYAVDVCVENREDLANRNSTHTRSLGLTDDRNVQCQNPVWTPDGKCLFYLAGDRLMRVDADGRNRQAVAAL